MFVVRMHTDSTLQYMVMHGTSHLPHYACFKIAFSWQQEPQCLPQNAFIQ